MLTKIICLIYLAGSPITAQKLTFNLTEIQVEELKTELKLSDLNFKQRACENVQALIESGRE